jgi:hypothetical protein
MLLVDATTIDLLEASVVCFHSESLKYAGIKVSNEQSQRADAACPGDKL